MTSLNASGVIFPLRSPDVESAELTVCKVFTKCRHCSWCGRVTQRPNYVVSHTACFECLGKSETKCASMCVIAAVDVSDADNDKECRIALIQGGGVPRWRHDGTCWEMAILRTKPTVQSICTQYEEVRRLFPFGIFDLSID